MRVAGAVLAVAIALQGCAFSNIDLVQDSRVHIVSPHDNQLVQLPVTIRWTSSGPTRFAVFLDRSPIRPGASLRSVASGDGPCLDDPTCPDAQYLRDHGVYVVDGDSIVFPALADLRSAKQTHDRHQVTVVVLDGDRRSGEGAFIRSFQVARGPSS